MLYPFKFHPIFKERVWGGRAIELLYKKPLPPHIPIGEAWEISDRPGDVSVIANGPLAGKDLHWLVENHPSELLGAAQPLHGRFPLLVKILDAQEKLSLQVHPPADIAPRLHGDPKTEMWYIAHASHDAELFVGLKRGVTREIFEQKLKEGTVAECFHRLPVRRHDAMFVPSGRVHAIGAGCLIFEIQQNSDTTFRVFDWNRLGLDGRPRALHIQESLASIDFSDFEPALIRNPIPDQSPENLLVDHDLFQISSRSLRPGESYQPPRGPMEIVGVIHGQLEILSHQTRLTAVDGDFILLPASLPALRIIAHSRAHFLSITVP